MVIVQNNHYRPCFDKHFLFIIINIYLLPWAYFSLSVYMLIVFRKETQSFVQSFPKKDFSAIDVSL